MNKYILFSLLVSMFFVSCNKKQKESFDVDKMLLDNPRNDMDMVRNSSDSTQVLDLAKEYLELLKGGNYESALDMLSSFDVTTDSISPLTQEERYKMLKNYNTFPVLNYTIDAIHMYSEYDTDVSYTIEWFEKNPDDSRPNTLQCKIYPRRVHGNWILTVQKMKVERPFVNN